MNSLNKYPQTDTKHNILTILSAIVFPLCLLIDEFADIRYNIIFLTITSLLYKYTYFYVDNEDIHTFFCKLDHIAIITMTLTHINISHIQSLIVTCIAMLKYEVFYSICFIIWIYLTIKMYFTDKIYFFIHIIAYSCHILSYINVRVTGKWTFWNSWGWHFSSIVWFICIVCTKHYN